MELAAQDARPVPREVSRKQGQSKGPGASAKPAEVVLTTRAVTHQWKCWSEAGFSGTWYRSSLPLVVDDDPTDSRWMFLHLKKSTFWASKMASWEKVPATKPDEFKPRTHMVGENLL